MRRLAGTYNNILTIIMFFYYCLRYAVEQVVNIRLYFNLRKYNILSHKNFKLA